MTQAQQFLKAVAEAIVDNPSAVAVESQTDERGVLLILKVDKTDMGKVIGKAGATASAIRTLLRVVGAKDRAFVSFKIAEPDGSFRYNNKPARREDVDAAIDGKF